MSLEIQFLPATDGDAIWVRWGEPPGNQLLIDMGREATGKAIRKRLEAVPADRRHFTLLVVTHVDGDHIGGVLSGLVDAGPLEGLEFDDVWFNGWPHLHGQAARHKGRLEAMGPVQGERLTDWLTGPWNEAFDRGPVERFSSLPVKELPGGMRLTVLGPTPSRLAQLRPTWEADVARAVKDARLPDRPGRLESLGRAKPVKPELESWADLRALANASSDPDDSAANGASICLCLEWERRRVLLTGDAWATEVVDGLRLMDQLPVAFDVVKAPHHGSQANVSEELVEAIACPIWALSTSGSRHYHPDAVAVARILCRSRPPRPELVFNVPSAYNAWWENPEWKKRFDYETRTGAEPEGIILSLEPA